MFQAMLYSNPDHHLFAPRFVQSSQAKVIVLLARKGTVKVGQGTAPLKDVVSFKVKAPLACFAQSSLPAVLMLSACQRSLSMPSVSVDR
jgi:hypothetical protein